MKNLLFFLAVASAAGCDSGLSNQIEKCVKAAMDSGEPYKDKIDRAGSEATARAYCMRAAAGKD